MANIEIDGKKLEVADGSMIIEAADAAGIYIPRFCYHEKLSIAANCRMCLVEVEKAPKPLPACATPVGEGMVIKTGSELAVEAQKGTMEFLLINHPLDCPVCDQGGECPLQDQAVGYGKGVSRFTEKKRVVENKEIGPLISTEMTRCIHCTRCVRFGQEIAGIMELGTAGRGENMEIGAFIGSTVDSEVSGNSIDLCPVGALTSRPYRFSARSWELESKDSISPHDSLGSNLKVQISHGEVKRVLPRENEEVNECWISDRDRYSYEGVNSAERLTEPMVKQAGKWVTTDWKNALEVAVNGLKAVIASRGKDNLGALVSPTATTEEHFLTQKLLRALGSGNVDHRLRQVSFDDATDGCPALGRPVATLDSLKACLIVGSNIRKEQPLLSVRLRKASLAGGQMMAVNPADFDFIFRTRNDVIAPSRDLASALATVAAACATEAGQQLPAEIAAWQRGRTVGDAERAIAKTLKEAAGDAAIIVGSLATQHPEYQALRAIAQYIGSATGASAGELPEANSVGAWLAGNVAHHGPGSAAASVAGKNTGAMLDNPPAAMLLLGIEPELDIMRSDDAVDAIKSADFVVAMSAFKNVCDDADVLLPIAPFTENEGTYVNLNGLMQSSAAALPCAGEARPAWKILRVMGNLFEAPGFDYVNVGDITNELPGSGALNPSKNDVPKVSDDAPAGVSRLIEVPLYRVDPVVRRGEALQQTLDNPGAVVGLSPDEASRLGVNGSGRVRVSADGSNVELAARTDERLPEKSAWIPSGYAETARLGDSSIVTIEKA